MEGWAGAAQKGSPPPEGVGGGRQERNGFPEINIGMLLWTLSRCQALRLSRRLPPQNTISLALSLYHAATENRNELCLPDRPGQLWSPYSALCSQR